MLAVRSDSLHKKTLLLIIAAVVLALVVAACGSPEATPTAAPQATPTPSTPGQTQPTPTPEPTFDAAAYFRGKTIRLMTSSNPGGGTDTQMRFMASQMGRYLPGNPRLIASNVPPHVVGKNYIYRAAADGLNIGLFSTSMLREERFPGATYNSAEYTYIADVGVSTNVFTIKSGIGYETIHDMIGASGPTIRYFSDASDPGQVESLLLAQLMIAEFLEMPFEVIRTAERGAGPAMLALERGDINWYQWGGGIWFLLPISRPGWLSDGYLIPVLHMGPGREFTGNSEVPEANFPHIYDLLTEEQTQQFIGITEAPRNMDRPLVMPPGVQPEVHQALTEAFHAAWQDPAFCADWERVTGSPCIWTPGEELTRRATEGRELMNQWADQYDSTAERLFNKYVR